MKLKQFGTVFLLAVIMLSSCRVKVTSSVEKNYFKDKKTFAWREEPVVRAKYDRESKRKQLEIEIKKEVERALLKNGFVYDSINPDFIVNYRSVYEKDRVGNKVSKSSLTGYTGGSAVNLNTLPIPQNSLAVLVQLLEPKTQQILWSGYTIRSTGDVMSVAKMVNDDVVKVVGKIPEKKLRVSKKASDKNKNS